MSYTEAPFVATIKGSGNHDAPWIVVRGDTADELEARLREVYKVGSAVVATASAFRNEWAAESGGQPAPQGQQSPAVQAVATGLDGQVVSSTPTSPAPSTPAPQAPAAGGSVEEDRWGGRYEHGLPNAPQTQWGPAVKFTGKSQAGKFYSRWIDPRSKKIPSVYQSGVREDPADLWPGEFAR